MFIRSTIITDEEAGILLPDILNTPENRQALIDAGANARDVGNGLGRIGRANCALITQENFQALIDAGANAYCVGDGLGRIGWANPALITQENRQALIDAGVNASGVGDGLGAIGEANPALITQENRQALIDTGANALSVGSLLSAIGRANPALITQENFQTLIDAGANVPGVGFGLVAIGEANPALITQENRQALIDAGANALGVGDGLGEIRRANPALITQENFQALIDAGANARGVGYGLIAIGRANPALITQENIQALIDAGANAQIIGQGLRELFETNRILVNQVNFTALVAQGGNALNHAREIIRRAQPAQERQALPVADRQSTHLASVHRSASDSATKLMNYYGSQKKEQNLEATLQEIRNWAQGLSDEKQSVKSCVQRLTAPGFTHEDSGSGVSMHQLLALTWKALHDEVKRQGSLKDGLNQFAQGLSEIQNEYGPGSPACTGGTFNKIIEKLVGIHPDAEQIVITPQQATAKLQSVVKEKAYKYLYSLASPETKEGLKAFTDLIEEIKGSGIEVIWDNIKDEVAIRMIDEFGSIYDDSKDNAEFKGLLAGSEYVYLDELDKFQEQISQSKGYNEFMKSVIRHSAASTQQSPEEPATSPGGKTRVSDLWVA